MTALDLDRLEALADAATPGPRTADQVYALVSPSKIDGFAFPLERHKAVTQGLADVEFIVATGPDVVKELVRQLREARAGQADAWDEGFHEGHRAARTIDHRDNPYRRNDE